MELFAELREKKHIRKNTLPASGVVEALASIAIVGGAIAADLLRKEPRELPRHRRPDRGRLPRAHGKRRSRAIYVGDRVVQSSRATGISMAAGTARSITPAPNLSTWPSARCPSIGCAMAGLIRRLFPLPVHSRVAESDLVRWLDRRLQNFNRFESLLHCHTPQDVGCRRECGWNSGDVVTGDMRVSSQAARSMG